MTAQHEPEAVSVLVATRDPLTVRTMAPIVAAKLYPGRRFGPVLYFEDAPEPGDLAGMRDPDGRPFEWTDAAVEVLPHVCDVDAGTCDERPCTIRHGEPMRPVETAQGDAWALCPCPRHEGA